LDNLQTHVSNLSVATRTSRTATGAAASQARPHKQRKLTPKNQLQQEVWKKDEENQSLYQTIRLFKEKEDASTNAAIHSSDVAANNSNESKLDAAIESGGVTRLTLISDEYHKKYPKAASAFFRFRTWEFTKRFIEAMFCVEYTEPTFDQLKRGLSKFEQCLLTLFYIESYHDMQFVAQVYGFKDHTAVSRIVNAWLPEWGILGRQLSVLPHITAELIDDLEPQSYIDLGLRKVGAILDGKDFYTETEEVPATIEY